MYKSSYQFKIYQRNMLKEKTTLRDIPWLNTLHCFTDAASLTWRMLFPVLSTWCTVCCILQVNDCIPLWKVPLNMCHIVNNNVPYFLPYAETQNMFSKRYSKYDYCLTFSNLHSTHSIVLSHPLLLFYGTKGLYSQIQNFILLWIETNSLKLLWWLILTVPL